MMGRYGVTIDFDTRRAAAVQLRRRAAPSPSATSPARWPNACSDAIGSGATLVALHQERPEAAHLRPDRGLSAGRKQPPPHVRPAGLDQVAADQPVLHRRRRRAARPCARRWICREQHRRDLGGWPIWATWATASPATSAPRSSRTTILDELIAYYARTGLPRRDLHALAQHHGSARSRLRALCEKHGLFQISGEDINSPRQSFVCEAQRDPGIRQPLRGHLGADRPRMARHRGSGRRPVLREEHPPLAESERPRARLRANCGLAMQKQVISGASPQYSDRFVPGLRSLLRHSIGQAGAFGFRLFPLSEMLVFKKSPGEETL